MAWIKNHVTFANLFYTMAWAYVIAGTIYMVFEGFSWWTLADVIAYSTLLWLIASECKQKAMYTAEIERLTNRNQVLKEQLRTRGVKI